MWFELGLFHIILIYVFVNVPVFKVNVASLAFHSVLDSKKWKQLSSLEVKQRCVGSTAEETLMQTVVHQRRVQTGLAFKQKGRIPPGNYFKVADILFPHYVIPLLFSQIRF